MACLSSTKTPERTLTVNFTCQRCSQPLKLDSSFYSLDDQMLSELAAPMLSQSDNESAVQLSQNLMSSVDSVVSRRMVLPLHVVESGNGFMLVGDNVSGSTESLGYHLRVTSHLFDIMTDQSDVDHPLCEECTDNLLDQMEKQLDMAEDECKDYKKFLEQLGSEDKGEDVQQLEEELRLFRQREEQLLQEIADVEQERMLVEEEGKKHQRGKERLQADEDRLWREYSDLKRQLLLCADDQTSVDNQLRYAQAQLDKLWKTNAFNATFHIWHSGHFGTINNFRLGRLPNVPVEWTEINAAWGQTVLLLHCLAKKMKLTFQRYKLVPYGNHSYLESLEDRSRELPLHFAGGFKFLWDTKFDQAMVAFLDCLQQFREEVEKGDPRFCLPYRMEKGKIENVKTGQSCSIKIQFNSEEQWTKALKFMLTNLKWGLAWVSAQFTNN